MNHEPDQNDGPTSLKHLFRETYDLVDEAVANTTDEQIEDRLRAVLRKAGYSEKAAAAEPNNPLPVATSRQVLDATEEPDLEVKLPPEPEPERESLNRQNDDFEAFYKRIYGPMIARAITLGCPRDSANDLVQNVMIKIWRNWAKIDWPTRSHHTFAVLHREVIERYRREQPRLADAARVGFEFGAESRLGAGDVELTTVSRLEAELIAQLVATRLPQRTREVLYMSVLGYTPAEIATHLGINASTARSHLQRAREILRNYLERSGSDA